MRKHWRLLLLFLLLLLAILLWKLVPAEYLTLANLKAQRRVLLLFVGEHYLEAVIVFISLYVGTALFLPGALVLSVAGGMLFGTLPATIYLNIGATAGALLAFLLARLLIGEWFQQRFSKKLHRFNNEMEVHGHNYLLILRIIPVVPFFVVNYSAGVTKMPLRTFVWTTSLGVLPGSLIHTYIGNHLATVENWGDLFSWKIILMLSLLALFPLIPIILHRLQPHLPE